MKRNISIKIISGLLTMLMILSIMGIGAFAEPESTGSSASTTQTQSATTQTPPAVTQTPDSSKEETTAPVTTPPEIISAYYEVDTTYKSAYFSGEEFDPTGITIVILYGNGTIERVALKDLGSYAPKTLGANDSAVVVTVSATWTVSIPVNVSTKTVTKISIKSLGSFDNRFLEGESFDPTGLTIEATYNDGTTETVDNSKLTFAPAGPLESTVKLVTISYGGKSIPMSVSVTPVKSIEVKPVSSPLTFGQYQIFDRSKVTVTATYTNGKTKEVTDYIVEDGGFTSSGEGTINIKYYAASASVEVTVNELEGIRVTKKPDKTSYNEGDSLDTKGLEVSGLYSGNATAPITGYTIDIAALEANEDEECVITISFDEFFTDTFTVSVSPITALNVVTAPTKNSYYEGEAIDLTGLVVEAVFKNGEKISDFKNYSLTAESLYANSAKSPVISYKGASATISISVIQIQAIGVTKNPDRVLYTEGEIFDPTGIEITAYYTDGTFNVVEAGACTYTSEPLQIHDTIVTVKYKNLSTQLNITVTKKVIVTSLDATNLPKVDYVSGQELDLTGLELTLILSDNTAKVLTPEEYTVQPAEGTKLFAGVDTMITITYQIEEGQVITLDIPITVSDKMVISLFISQMPNKVVYSEGEVFDPTGMVVRAFYNDNTTEEITNYEITTDPFVIGSENAQKVRVYIKAGTAEESFDVTVNPVAISMITISTPPMKVAYKAGERFDPTGMVVRATYANGSVITVPIENCTITPTGALTASDTMVTVLFRGKTASLSISIDGSEIVTTSPPDTSTEPNGETTATPGSDSGTTSGSGEGTENTQTNTPSTTDEETEKPSGGMSGTLLVIFICLIVFIVALVVVLIIYYRRHFC